jgi:hypothetical protein
MRVANGAEPGESVIAPMTESWVPDYCLTSTVPALPRTEIQGAGDDEFDWLPGAVAELASAWPARHRADPITARIETTETEVWIATADLGRRTAAATVKGRCHDITHAG